jgi:hypothetical protein
MIGNGISGSMVPAEHDSVTEYYDELPPRLRQALANLPFKFSGRHAKQFLDGGATEDQIIGSMVREACRIHSTDVENGLTVYPLSELRELFRVLRNRRRRH